MPRVSSIFLAGFALALMAIGTMTAQAQTTGITDAGPGMQGIGLTPVQKRIIYENTSGERQQPLPNAEAPTLGAPIPDSLILNEMPVHVKDEIGVLRDFKFAVLQNAQSVLIVDPASRKIVDIVTRDDARK